ncbi:hypothetical protein D3C84_1190490 [compost metagenome]
MALFFAQGVELLLGFHPLGRDGQAHGPAQVDDCLDHRTVIAITAQAGNEPFVDLDAIERVGAQVTQ